MPHHLLIHGSIMPEFEGSTTHVSLLLRLGHDPSDQAAWEEFVDRYGAKMHSWCRAWALQEADAEDVTQAVLAKLAALLRRFSYDPSQSFRGWLRTLVNNACRDCMADRRRTIGAVARGQAGEVQLANGRHRCVERVQSRIQLCRNRDRTHVRILLLRHRPRPP